MGPVASAYQPQQEPKFDMDQCVSHNTMNLCCFVEKNHKEGVPMAVTFVRSALMVPGKFPQAHEYLEKRIKWLKEKFGVEPSLMVLLGGQVGRIATVTEQDNVAQIEKIRREIVGGALPKELATGAEGLFVPGEAKDRIWLKIR
jgi:hypothetical protein